MAGKEFSDKNLEANIMKPSLVMADMFSLPLAGASIDVVYTNHALEPNGGHEKELLQELYRVAGEYLILLEPAYEFASEEAKKRMERHGYIRDLYQTAKSLQYDVITWELYGESANELNPTGLMIIKKDPGDASKYERNSEIEYICPLTHMPLELLGNVYYSKDSMLAYPVLNGIPCLLSEYAVVATKMQRYFS